MRKILILALLVSVLMGATMPATAILDTKIGINNAIGVQTQVAVPISIAVLGGSTGYQDAGQGQAMDFRQKIKR